MKRVLCALLILLMLTPGMACAAQHCAQMQQEPAKSQDMPQNMPCHDTGNTGQQDDDTGQPCGMFMKDCAKIDLQTGGDIPVLKKPSNDGKTFDAAVSVVLPLDAPATDAHAIRGPPGWLAALLPTTPPVIHETQRFRE